LYKKDYNKLKFKEASMLTIKLKEKAFFLFRSLQKYSAYLPFSLKIDSNISQKNLIYLFNIFSNFFLNYLS